MTSIESILFINCSVFVPYKITSRIKKSTETLTRIYDYSHSHNKDLYKFLSKECNHLLIVPEDGSPTDISIDILKKPKFTTNLTEKYISTVTKNYAIQSGVYSFEYNNKVVNIGSTTEFKTRLGNYYQDYRKTLYDKSVYQRTFFDNVKKVGGFSQIQYNILYVTPNFKQEYLAIPNIQKDGITLSILTNFSKHQPRILEQALLSYFNPSWNSTREVILDYMNWTSTIKTDTHGVFSYNIFVTSEDGNTLNFQSIKSASKILGIDEQEIKRLLNTVPPVQKYIPSLDSKITIYSPDAPEKLYNPEYGFYPEITDYDLSIIPLGKIRVVDSENMNQTFGDFSNSKKAMEAINCSHNKPRRYINKQYKFITKGLISNSFYLLRNPNTSPRNNHKIELFNYDPLTSLKVSVKVFDSIADVRRYFNIKPNNHNWYNDYVKTGKVYKKDNKFWLIEDFIES